MSGHFDSFLVPAGSSLHWLLAGRTVRVTHDERGDFTVTVVRPVAVVCGLDRHGVFAGVECEVGGAVFSFGERTLTFYSDGTVADADDRTVGRHDLRQIHPPTDAEMAAVALTATEKALR